jgi:hypothetical protein
MGMWRVLLVAIFTALAGCSTQKAVRVRCDRHLVPINVPAPADHHSAPRSSSAPAGGDNP